MVIIAILCRHLFDDLGVAAKRKKVTEKEAQKVKMGCLLVANIGKAVMLACTATNPTTLRQRRERELRERESVCLCDRERGREKGAGTEGEIEINGGRMKG